MSRIGLKPVNLPAGVDVKVEGNTIVVKGPKGQLQEQISDRLTVEIKEGVISVSRASDAKSDRTQQVYPNRKQGRQQRGI